MRIRAEKENDRAAVYQINEPLRRVLRPSLLKRFVRASNRSFRWLPG